MPAVAGGAGGREGRRPHAPDRNLDWTSARRWNGGKLHGAIDPRAALGVATAVLVVAVALAMSVGGGGRIVAHALSLKAAQVSGKLGVRLERVRLQGVSDVAKDDVLRALHAVRGTPLLELDLRDLRERIERVGWVRSARVARLFPDTLIVAIVERPRLAVWQIDGRLRLVDPEGQIIPEADAARFPDLPLIVGEGANEAASAMLPLVQARPRLFGKIDALVRVDRRRWDLHLRDGGIVQLPAKGEDGALIQLDELDQRSRLLELGFARIDLRDPDLVTVRPRSAASASGAR